MNGTTTRQSVIAFTVSRWMLATATAPATLPAPHAGSRAAATPIDRHAAVDDHADIHRTAYLVAPGSRPKT